MYKVDEHVSVAVAGITADANILINQARLHAQRYRFSFQEPQPVEQLVQTLCDEKQAYTQYGGLRPFGVSMLYAGWDKTYGFQLYQSDPSGNYNGWKATCIGANHQSATSLMKQEYKGEGTMPLTAGAAARRQGPHQDVRRDGAHARQVRPRDADPRQGREGRLPRVHAPREPGAARLGEGAGGLGGRVRPRARRAHGARWKGARTEPEGAGRPGRRHACVASLKRVAHRPPAIDVINRKSGSLVEKNVERGAPGCGLAPHASGVGQTGSRSAPDATHADQCTRTTCSAGPTAARARERAARRGGEFAVSA